MKKNQSLSLLIWHDWTMQVKKSCELFYTVSYTNFILNSYTFKWYIGTLPLGLCAGQNLKCMQVVWHIICMMYDGVVSYNIKFMGFYYILLICTCTYHVSRPWMSASILHITCTGEYHITILQDMIWNYNRSFRLYFIVFTKYMRYYYRFIFVGGGITDNRPG